MPDAPVYQIEVQSGPVYEVTVASTETAYTVEVQAGPTYQVEMQLGTGPAGSAATVAVDPASGGVPFGTPTSVTNTGTAAAAVLLVKVQEGKAGVDGTGNVNGPGSSTDGYLAVFDGATGKLLKSGGAVPVPATANPAALGTAAVGTSVKYAREDHVHPIPAAVTSYAQAFLLGGM